MQEFCLTYRRSVNSFPYKVRHISGKSTYLQAKYMHIRTFTTYLTTFTMYVFCVMGERDGALEIMFFPSCVADSYTKAYVQFGSLQSQVKMP